MASNVKLIAEEVFGLYDDATLRRDSALARRSANRFNQSLFPRRIAARGVGHCREARIREGSDRSLREIAIPVLHAARGAAGSVGLDLFQETLDGIETASERRGSDSNGHTYAYLMPSKIPQSVNV
jgi:hypothetical protein